MSTSEQDQSLAMLGCVPLLAAEDVSAVAGYYRDTLGFEIADEWPGLWVRLRREALVVEIEQSDAIRRIGPFEKGASSSVLRMSMRGARSCIGVVPCSIRGR